MIIKVKIEDQVYEVEINDLRQRPIKALVDGNEFEIWPEGEPSVQAKNKIVENGVKPEAWQKPASASSASAPAVQTSREHSEQTTSAALMLVRAPIPGVITAVNIHSGEEVVVGQQLCVLEAMKMNNSIRASRAGRIASIHVTVGQHVKHHDILLEYAD